MRKLFLTGVIAITPHVINVQEITNSQSEPKIEFEIEQPQRIKEDVFTQYRENKDRWVQDYGEDLTNKLKNLRLELQERGHLEEDVKKILKNADVDDDVTRFFRRNVLRTADSGEITFEEFSERIGLQWFVNNAQSFADKYEEVLKETEMKDNVDLRYIVGIIGIETKFGDNNNLGIHNLINSLVTQYVTTRRQSFAVRELNYVLELTKKFGESFTEINGSYAGAIGIGQWIPSSIYYYSTVESVGDLFCVEKMIPSVSNYLKEHGWDSEGNNKSLFENNRNWRAVRAYNHSDTYVKVVDEIAKGVKKSFKKSSHINGVMLP